MFCWELISLDNATVGERFFHDMGFGVGSFYQSVWFKRVSLFGSYGLLGEDLLDKEGLSRLVAWETYMMALTVAVMQQPVMLCFL